LESVKDAEAKLLHRRRIDDDAQHGESEQKRETDQSRIAEFPRKPSP
jgi:hypothetical protein